MTSARVRSIIELDGKRYAWRDIVRLRRERQQAARHPQPALFELRDDARPAATRTADRRYREPTLFKID